MPSFHCRKCKMFSTRSAEEVDRDPPFLCEVCENAMKANAEQGRHDFWVYAHSTNYASVCSSLPLEETTERLNAMNDPPDDNGRWRYAKELTFANGNFNGRPCNEYPGTHRHFLFER